MAAFISDEGSWSHSGLYRTDTNYHNTNITDTTHKLMPTHRNTNTKLHVLIRKQYYNRKPKKLVIVKFAKDSM